MHRNKKIKQLIPIYVLVISCFLSIGFGGNKMLTVLSEEKPLHDRCTVIIDPGHGGEDGGAVSRSGVLESKINLQIAQRLQDLLHLLGMKTHMIRNSDISVYTEGKSIAARKVSDLKERVRLMNSVSDAVVVSIHQNFFSDEKYSGTQVFYPNTPDSKALANDLQNTFREILQPDNHRTVRQAGNVYIMQHIRHTGVLVECGFLSNRKEDVLLQNSGYQKKISCILAACISQFLSNKAIT